MNFTTPAIAEQRRNQMIADASQRSLARTARAARRNQRPTGRLQALVDNLFNRPQPAPAPAETLAPADTPAEYTSVAA